MTSKEQSIAKYEKLREQMIDDGYTEHVCTISVLKANLMAFLTAGPFAILAIVVYIILYGFDNVYPVDMVFCLIVLVLFIISIPIHEGLHGLGWGMFCKQGLKSIRFGILKEMLTPYCHCGEALYASQYIIGGLMPFVVLGIVPLILALVFESPLLLWFSVFSILGAGGDTTIAYYLLKHWKDRIIDHPSECGFVAFMK